MSLTVRQDPRSGTGLCARCKYLFATESANGTRVLYCKRFTDMDSASILIPIKSAISSCTDFSPLLTGPFSTFDAWNVSKNTASGEVTITHPGGTLRRAHGQYETARWEGGKHIWSPFKPGDENEQE